jgi:ATP-dependent Clp protease ATP-binding subunit ClpA
VYPFERFSQPVKEALTRAQAEAEHMHHSYIGTEHLMLGLLQSQGLAARALSELGIKLEASRAAVEKALSASPQEVVVEMVPTSRTKRLIEMAFEIAREHRALYVGTQHLLLAMLREGQGIGAHVLMDQGVRLRDVESVLQRLEQAGESEQTSRREGLEQQVVTGSVTWHVLSTHNWFAQPKSDLGGTVHVDLRFPGSYSLEQCQKKAEIIAKAIEEAFPPPHASSS